MTGRERVYNALNFKKVDKVPLEYHPSFCGLYEHGEKYRALVKSMPGDFEDVSDCPVPVPQGKFLPDGSYYERRADGWGVEWEYLIFGIMGHPVSWPLADFSKLDSYKFPPNAFDNPAGFDWLCAALRKSHDAGLFHKAGGGGIFEIMHSLVKFEDVLMEIADDTEFINRLADKLVDWLLVDIELAIKAGSDAVSFGDDFGTQKAIMLSPELWRHFFAPRYRRLLEPVKKAGVKALFHSCGQIAPILDDFARLGFDSIWPQQSLFNTYELAAHCREIGLAVCIHIDRAGVMTRGTPADVERALETAIDAYKPYDGGSWMYIEVDNGFPFENIQALFDTFRKYR